MNDLTTALKLIDTLGFSDEVKEGVLYYCNEVGAKKDLSASRKGFLTYKTNLHKVLRMIPKNIEDFSWNNYCKLMNHIYLDSSIDRKAKPREILSEIYNLFIDLNEVLSHLKPFQKFFISEEKVLDGVPTFVRENMATNFPINSSIESVELFEWKGRGKGSPTNQTIINLNTNNIFLKQLLTIYLHRLPQGNVSYLVYRQFIYYFVESLPKSINSLEDFNLETFKFQYRFYLEKNEEIFITDEKKPLKKILVSFYSVLFDLFKENGIKQELFEGSMINKSILSSKSFCSKYEQGYMISHSSAFSSPEELDKVGIINSDSKSNIRNQNISYFDFSLAEDENYKELLKDYILNCIKLTPKTKAGRFSHLVDFLNRKKKYNDELTKFERIERNELVDTFDAPFVYGYAGAIRDKYNDQEAIRFAFKSVRSFLSYHQKTLKMNPILLSVINEEAKNYTGGSSINQEDLLLVFEEFKKNKINSVEDELYYIIFILCSTTRLRLGEVLNLTLDYKVPIYVSDDTTTIQFYSKTSGGEKIQIALPNEKVALLERAIEITKFYRANVEDELKQYIFIIKDKGTFNRYLKVNYHFQAKFNETMKRVLPHLKDEYTPYNLRHTFVNTVYVKGMDDNVSILILEEATGIRSSTALKHYVKEKQLIEYAETFSGVSLSDETLTGEIVEEIQLLTELPEVEKGLGVCKSEECDDESKRYECLRCKKFATSISRISAFENGIEQLKYSKEIATNRAEQRYLEKELELLTTYYVRLLELSGVKGGS